MITVTFDANYCVLFVSPAECKHIRDCVFLIHHHVPDTWYRARCIVNVQKKCG